MPDTLDSLFDKDGRAQNGFAGIGKLSGRQDYSEDEITVLDHFFTRHDSNVYAATDAMPGRIWPSLMGQYARSNMTARDRFLKLIEDTKKKDASAPSMQEVAEAIRSGAAISELLEKAIAKAGRWVENYGIAYGHASLRDSGTIRMCFEGVSQRVTKALESAREGAYQEQSTRAVPFRVENLGVPFEIRGTNFERDFFELGQGNIALYDKIMDNLPSHLGIKYAHLRTKADEEVRNALQDPNEKLSEPVWQGVLREKSFDVARYLLPQFITTSLGITLNARRFQDQLTEWQSSEFAELRVLGRAAQAEAMMLNPDLMKYGNRSKFIAALPEKRRQLFRKISDAELLHESHSYQEYPISSRLISSTPDLEDIVLASIIFAGSDGQSTITRIISDIKQMPLEQRRAIAESQIRGKSSHELYPKVMEVGSFVFERLYDIGAFRDLQRQRGDRQQIGPYGMIGYSIPLEVKEIGLIDQFIARMNATKEIHDRLIAAGMPHVAEYVPAMANLIRHVVTKDPVQCFYEAKLRTQPGGIDSYREIARQEIEQVLSLMPAFTGLIEYTPGEYPLNKLSEKVRTYIENRKATKS
jgi:thymidylate synthase ThyX